MPQPIEALLNPDKNRLSSRYQCHAQEFTLELSIILMGGAAILSQAKFRTDAQFTASTPHIIHSLGSCGF